MSTRACPNCGASISEAARFCGQCGTTIAAQPAGARPAHAPNVHEEVTVARDRPDLDAMQALIDAGERSDGRAPAPGVAKTQLLGQTLNDPQIEARAKEVRDAVLGVAPTAQAAPIAPKANLARTMMMGGAGAPPPPAAGATTGSASDRPTAPPAEPAPHRVGDASPLSMSVVAPQVPVAQPPEAQPQQAQAHPQPQPQGMGRGAPALRTMMGMPAKDLPPRSAGASAGPPDAAPAPAPAPGPAPYNAQKTMLGVAIPGIAPTHGQAAGPIGAPAPAAAAPPPQGPGAIDLRSKQSTMLGVAIPGIAPTRGPADGAGGHGGTAQMPQAHQAPRMPSQVQNTALGVMAPPELQIVPRPKTLIDEPLPVAPQLPQKRGVPAVAVVGILSAVVLVLGGVGVYFAMRHGGTLTAVPQLDENGRESLKIGCPTCPDGTTIALGASTATVTASAAVLPLPAPLSIGENDLSVRIDRPAGGRDEDVKVHVPVAYRVRADLSTLSAKPPAITVRIEATPGSTVTVDEKPVTLDGTGRGSYAIELAKETQGPGEPTTFERKIPFAITPSGGKLENGQLTARTAIVPLALDAPGRELITDRGTVAVAGQTRPGTIVTIDGQGVAVDAQGRFGVRVELGAMGDKPLEIVASAPPLAPRIAKVKVTRVASLEVAAKGEDAQNPALYDVFGAEPESKVDQKVMVEGEVVEARATAGHTVLIIDDKKKCAKGAACLVRVVHGEDDKVARGDTVRAYGRLLGSVAASGRTMPDIEASLVLPVKAAGK